MRIWAFAVRRWQFTLLLFGLLIALGLTTLRNIPRSEDPEFHAPVPIIVVVYPGADPADIERLIVDPIEELLAASSSLEEVRDGLAAQIASMDAGAIAELLTRAGFAARVAGDADQQSDERDAR